MSPFYSAFQFALNQPPGSGKSPNPKNNKVNGSTPWTRTKAISKLAIWAYFLTDFNNRFFKWMEMVKPPIFHVN